MKPKLLVLIIAVLTIMLTIVSCTMSSGHTGDAYGIMPAPQLGVVTDENFRVIDVRPNSSAASAGVQVGDVLLDLTWIPTDEPMYLPEESDILYVDQDGYLVDSLGNPLMDATGRRLTPDDIIMKESAPPTEESTSDILPTPPNSPLVLSSSPGYTRSAGSPVADYADYIEKDTLPFTAENASRIKNLASYGVPLKLRLRRDGQTIEVTIVPTSPRHLSSELDASNRPITTPTPITPGHYKF